VPQRTYVFHFKDPQPQRLDHFLSACLPELSRSRLQVLIGDGLVTVDGAGARKNGQMLAQGSVIRVDVPPRPSPDAVAEKIDLDIVFEDSNVLIVNKPAGMVVHPAVGHPTGTLVNAALGYEPSLRTAGDVLRPGIVHRLDKATSGLIVLAKNDTAHRWLQDQFRLRQVHKTYLALVDGQPPTDWGRVDAPIGRDPAHRKQMAIVPPGKGREAITDFKTLESFVGHTLLELHPITGRTHQIRLHCKFLKCPVAGDTVYGLRPPTVPLKRHFLHAARLTLALPGEAQPRTFEAALPRELEDVLAEARRQTIHR
jgi:23S rRNA pseudouridine1911/1915/1917 synthase